MASSEIVLVKVSSQPHTRTRDISGRLVVRHAAKPARAVHPRGLAERRLDLAHRAGHEPRLTGQRRRDQGDHQQGQRLVEVDHVVGDEAQVVEEDVADAEHDARHGDRSEQEDVGDALAPAPGGGDQASGQHERQDAGARRDHDAQLVREQQRRTQALARDRRVEDLRVVRRASSGPRGRSRCPGSSRRNRRRRPSPGPRARRRRRRRRPHSPAPGAGCGTRVAAAARVRPERTA